MFAEDPYERAAALIEFQRSFELGVFVYVLMIGAVAIIAAAIVFGRAE